MPRNRARNRARSRLARIPRSLLATTLALVAAGCGGLTGVTPLTLYRDWIAKTVRGWMAR